MRIFPLSINNMAWGIITGLVFLMLQIKVFAGDVVELTIDGSIGAARADYIIHGIESGQNAELILIKMDTPGGLDSSMRKIIQAFLVSKVPIVVFVTPSGARAASAGTFLVYASTIAAMAPGTQLGAASPVNLMESYGKPSKSTIDKKATNDAIATLRSLAQLRNRNLDFSDKAISSAKTMTSQEALKVGVINLIAKDENDLLTQLNGMVVLQNGRQITLNTQNVNKILIEPDWRTRFLLIITEPTVAYLLLLLGLYGIFFELMTPGAFVPGVLGGVSLLIALYAFQLLPVNYAGLGLIVLGIFFIIAEIHVQSFGVLGLTGSIAFIVGSIMLLNKAQEGYHIAWSVMAALIAVNLLVVVTLAIMFWRSRRRALLHGINVLLGAQGRALEPITQDSGQAIIRGEIWSVRSKNLIESKSKVRVVSVSGLILEVEKTNGNYSGSR